MIPKIIHYCWFGGNNKPELLVNCLSTWQNYLPDYEIVEWNDSHIDLISNRYFKQAYEAKQWAFASDYFRLWALYHYGGIYLDTDVEVTASLNNFLNNNFFTCFEVGHNCKVKLISTATIGAIKKCELINHFLLSYENEQFKIKNNFNLTPNTTKLSLLIAKKYNLAPPYNSNTSLILEDKHIIYPAHFFSTQKDNLPNFAIHHFAATWKPNYSFNGKRKDKFHLPIGIIFARYATDKNESFPIKENEKLLFKFRLKNNLYAVIKLYKPDNNLNHPPKP